MQKWLSEMLAFTLVVYGTPAPAGSKRPFKIRKGGVETGQVVTVDASRRAAPWKATIKQEAGEAMQGRELMRQPIAVRFTFYVRRPKSHLGARGLRPSAPAFPAVKPDVLKLARAVEDALTGIVYADDAQIVSEKLVKRYGEPERVEIDIRPAVEMESAG